MKLLVLGGGGFLGARIARQAMSLGDQVIAVGRSMSAARLSGLPEVKVRYASLDLTVPGALISVLRMCEPDVLIHAAAPGVLRNEAMNSEMLLHANTAIGAELADIANQGIPIIWIGSCFEYAPACEPIGEGWPLEPVSTYGRSKLEGWKSFIRRASSLRRVLLLRLFHLYGPGESQRRLAPSALLAAIGRAPNRFGNREAVRDFVYVDDAARVVLRAARELVNGTEYGGASVNIASGKGTKLGDFVEAAAEAADRPGFHFEFLGKPPIAGYDPLYLVGRPELAQEKLGWTAETVLRDGLRTAFAALRETMNELDAR